jgi:hypothetical protein
MEEHTMTKRKDRNFARSIRHRIGRQPMSLDDLAEATGYPREMIAARLEWWRRLGMAKTVLLGVDSSGKNVVAYRAAASRYQRASVGTMKATATLRARTA